MIIIKCENCLKQDVCLFLSKSANFLGKKQALTENVDCCRFEDKSHWVKLPCMVGDKVYFIYHGDKAFVVEGVIVSFKQKLGLCKDIISEVTVKKYFDNGKTYCEILDFSNENETWFKSKIDAENKVKWWNE